MAQQCMITLYKSYLTKMDRTLQMDTFQTAVSSNTAFPSAPSSFPTPLASHQPLHAPLSNNLRSSACPKSIWHCTCRFPPQLPQQGFVKMMRQMWQNWRTHLRKALQLPSIFQQSLASPSAASPTEPHLFVLSPQKMASLELLTAQQFARNMAGWQNFVSCTSELFMTLELLGLTTLPVL